MRREERQSQVGEASQLSSAQLGSDFTFFAKRNVHHDLPVNAQVEWSGDMYSTLYKAL